MPLTEESKGYDFKGRTPTGRCIVEGRGNTGKLSLWIQDLKPQVKYEVYLIFAENRRYVGLSAGLLDVDTKGKAEIRRDIADLHTLVLKEFVAVAVIAAGQTGVVSPLCGYRNEQMAWRHGFEVYEAGQREEVVRQAEPEPSVIEPEIFEPEPEVPVTEPEIFEPEQELPVVEPETFEPEPELPVAEPEIYESEQEFPVAEPEIFELEPEIPVTELEFFEPEPEPPAAEPETVQPIAPPPSPPRAILPTNTEPPPQPTSQNTAMLIESIFNANTPFQPFQNQEDNLKWVRCNEFNQMPLPPDLPHLMTEPFIQAAWADHEHFILGVSETQQYIIGVAGMYTQENRQQAKRLGFSQFRSAGDSGYWLMFVDF